MSKDLIISASKLSWSAPLQHCSKWDKSRTVAKFRSEVLKRDGYKCKTCGWYDKEFLELHHIDDNHSNFKLSNLEAICPLCHMVHHPALASLSSAGYLIWLPEMSQVQLNLLMFHIIAVERAGTKHPWNNLAKAMINIFDVRKALFENQIGKSDPATLGQILINMPEDSYNNRFETLSSVKLLASPSRYEIEADYWLTKLNEKYPSEDMAEWAEKLKITDSY